MAADLVTIATTAVLTQFLTPAAKNLGEVALERAKRVGSQAADYLLAVGREPRPVEAKVLLPLVQAAGLETSEALSERWAALLAHAADPAQQVQVDRGYVETLSQLRPTDALVLNLIYQNVRADDRDALVWESAPIRTEGFAEQLGVSTKAFALSIDKLLRLRLCGLPTPRKGDLRSTLPAPPSAAAFQVCPTIFGREFLTACAPPTA